MAIYSRGKKVKSIYVRGKAVDKVFTRGKSVYENYPQLLGAMRLDITSNNSNSVSGYMTFAKYLDFDKELNMEIIRYETALKELKNFVVTYSGSGDIVKEQSPNAGDRIKSGEKVRILLG